jgi:hypothetical protein
MDKLFLILIFIFLSEIDCYTLKKIIKKRMANFSEIDSTNEGKTIWYLNLVGTTVITHKKNFITHSPIFITQIPL